MRIWAYRGTFEDKGRWEVAYGVCTHSKRLKKGQNKGCF